MPYPLVSPGLFPTIEHVPEGSLLISYEIRQNEPGSPLTLGAALTTYPNIVPCAQWKSEESGKPTPTCEKFIEWVERQLPRPLATPPVLMALKHRLTSKRLVHNLSENSNHYGFLTRVCSYADARQLVLNATLNQADLRQQAEAAFQDIKMLDGDAPMLALNTLIITMEMLRKAQFPYQPQAALPPPPAKKPLAQLLKLNPWNHPRPTATKVQGTAEIIRFPSAQS